VGRVLRGQLAHLVTALAARAAPLGLVQALRAVLGVLLAVLELLVPPRPRVVLRLGSLRRVLLARRRSPRPPAAWSKRPRI